MLYATIDCGTTNSRVYIVDETGRVYGKATKQVGVRDTATTGSRDVLRAGLRETVARAAADAGVKTAELQAIFSSGMITSEIGLVEIPHLMAPCGMQELAEQMTPVSDAGLTEENIPVYFVRGIKNHMEEGGTVPAASVVGELDFMRGEETQVAGLLEKPDVVLPVMVVILSSHTKFIPVSAEGKILGSLTTMSGQLYDAVIHHTFVGKSVEKREHSQEAPENYFDASLADEAVRWIRKGGLVRACMFPRFLDVLLDTEWYERALFFDALIAAEDMLCVNSLDAICPKLPEHFLLVGQPERARLYEYVIAKAFPDIHTSTMTDIREIDALSIRGVLGIARKAGLIHG